MQLYMLQCTGQARFLQAPLGASEKHTFGIGVHEFRAGGKVHRPRSGSQGLAVGDKAPVQQKHGRAAQGRVSQHAHTGNEFFGQKAIGVTVVYADATTDEFSFSTDAEFLRQALEEQKLVEGEESQYGLYVKTVNGVTADEAKEEWWCFTKDGEDVMTGVDSTPVADGDHFEITLKTGY